jgi:hypothetical protein
MIALPVAALLAVPASAQLEAPAPTGGGGADPGADTWVSPIHQATGADRMAEVTRVADALRPIVEGSDVASKARLLCWLDKVKDPAVDDRMIEWSRICPPRASDGLMGDARCATIAVQRDLMLDMLRDPAQFDETDRALNLTARVRSLVLVMGSGDRSANAPRELDNFEFDVKTAATELARLPADSKSLHYLAVKQWIAARTQDSTSLYNLCPSGG